MPYDRNDYTSGAETFGFGGAAINLGGGDFAVNDTIKAIVVTNAGTVVLRPIASGADITMTGLPAGYILPFHCSFIRQTGTTASLATIIGR